MKRIDKEAERRYELIFQKAGVRDREQYNEIARERGWEVLPLLVVVASDVGDSLENDFEELMASLVSKARALGIRVIASMQTPTGKDMRWRMNLSAVLSGSVVDSSQDGPALGVRATRTLRFKPSDIPPPPRVRGVFVARIGGDITLLRTVVLAGEKFENERLFNAAVAKLPKYNRPLPILTVNKDGEIEYVDDEPPAQVAQVRPAQPKAEEPVLSSTLLKDLLTAQDTVAEQPDEEALPESREELRALTLALRLRSEGRTETEAIEEAFKVRAGEGRSYRRARALFKTAQAV